MGYKRVVYLVSVLVMLVALLFGGCQPEAIETTTTPTSPTTAKLLTIHFIDVEHGDSILIDFDDTEVLIDGGDNSANIVSYLNKYVDGNLDIMVATHPHADHIGGLLDVFDAFQIDQIWYNGEESSSAIYSDFINLVQTENAQVYIGKRGDHITAGGLTFTILNPFNLSGTTNNNSLVLHLKYGKVDFLFTGDAEKEAEASMLAASDIPVPDVEIIKVGRHGSNTASSTDFLQITKPEIAIYMTGVGNSYGFPHTETILALENIGSEIFGTDVNGTIIVSTDGNSYTVTVQKETTKSTIIPTTSTSTTPTTSPPTTTMPPATTLTPTVTTEPSGSPPIIIWTSPADGKRDVRSYEKINIHFSEPMDKEATEQALIIRSTSPRIVNIEILWEEDGRVMVITALNYWQPEAEYTLTITNQARSEDGLYMEEDYSFTFKIDPC